MKNPEVLRICKAVREAGGHAWMVGGWVRDWLTGIVSKDFDIEVYGLEPDRLREVLEEIAPVNTVGEHFSVYKLGFYHDAERFEVDVSIPRRESKSGRGHRGFVIAGDPTMSLEEAARRRDFTVNAILFDPLINEIVDPFGGVRDLKNRVLRVVAADTFVEDSLRVLRAVQLAARFEMTVEPQTAELCRSIDLSDLPRERIWGEVEKWLMLARHPAIGLDVALELGVLGKLFPEIAALVGCPQDNESHPEGDVFTHTKLCLDEAAKVAADLPREKRLTLMLAMLCHDLGKPLATRSVDGRVSCVAHDEAGLDPARAVLDRLGLYTLSGYDVRSGVLALVREHLRPRELYGERERVTAGDLRRLARRVDMDLLYRMARADALGRGPAASTEVADWFISRVREVGVERGAPEPLLKGRHLVEAGFEPGPRMGEILGRVYELQLDDEVKTVEEALAAARRLV
jgi:tRNA nucleotidyltransferase (CCA-adding enzyme)